MPIDLLDFDKRLPQKVASYTSLVAEQGNALAEQQTHVFHVYQLGIKDIDGYGHVWYGNYLKFFERGMQAFLGGGSFEVVEHLKYRRSVPWGAAHSQIETYLVSRPALGRALVYQRWCVGDDADNTSALCLALVSLPPGCGDAVPVMGGGERLERKGPKLAMAVKNLQTGAVKPSDGTPIGQMLAPRRIFGDMVLTASGTGRGRLQLVDVMDLFEQSCTEVVGGQPGLKAFLGRGLALVVGQIDELVLAPDTPLDAGVDVTCEVTLLREYAGRKCFDFQQRLLHADGAELARVRVLMCCVNPTQGELTTVPQDSWDDWVGRMAERGTLYRAP